jgi:hypothetical protein
MAVARALLWGVLIVCGLAVAGWTALALWYQAPGGAMSRVIFVIAWVVVLGGLVLLARCDRVKAGLGFGGCLLAVAVWWSSIEPRLDRAWAPDVARTVTGRIDGDILTLENVRVFAWTSASEAREAWETRRYDLSKLVETDLILSYWGMGAIAHTLVSFGFSDGQRVVFSVEIRRETTERFSSVAGFFKVYEFAFIAAEEQDILYLRTNMRKEDTYLYPLALSPQAGVALLRSYVSAANERAVEPAFYNTLTTNCTTVIFDLARLVVPGIRTDWRILASGYLPGYLADHEATRWQGAEAELRRRAAISAKAQALASPGEDYSRVVRARF